MTQKPNIEEILKLIINLTKEETVPISPQLPDILKTRVKDLLKNINDLNTSYRDISKDLSEKLKEDYHACCKAAIAAYANAIKTETDKISYLSKSAKTLGELSAKEAEEKVKELEQMFAACKDDGDRIVLNFVKNNFEHKHSDPERMPDYVSHFISKLFTPSNSFASHVYPYERGKNG